MGDADGLTQAFAGMDGVFVLLPPIFDPSPGFPEARAVIAAVRQVLQAAKPGRVVCLSTVGGQATQPSLLGQLSLMRRELGMLKLPFSPSCAPPGSWTTLDTVLGGLLAR